MLVLALTGCVDVNLDTMVALYPRAVNSRTSHSRGGEWDPEVTFSGPETTRTLETRRPMN